MTQELSLFEIEQRYHAFYQAGRWAEALALATREHHRYPYHSQKIVYLWRACPACRLGETRLALALLEEAAAQGHRYSGLDNDPDLAPLHGRPEFEALLERFEATRLDAIAEAVPVQKILPPAGGAAPYPLLVALHGAQSNVESFAGHWQAARNQSWSRLTSVRGKTSRRRDGEMDQAWLGQRSSSAHDPRDRFCAVCVRGFEPGIGVEGGGQFPGHPSRPVIFLSGNTPLLSASE